MQRCSISSASPPSRDGGPIEANQPSGDGSSPKRPPPRRETGAPLKHRCNKGQEWKPFSSPPSRDGGPIEATNPSTSGATRPSAPPRRETGAPLKPGRPAPLATDDCATPPRRETGAPLKQFILAG